MDTVNAPFFFQALVVSFVGVARIGGAAGLDSEFERDGSCDGFQPNLQERIGDFWKTYLEVIETPETEDEFVDFLETVYDNASVDLMSNNPMPKHGNLTAILLSTQQHFTTAESNGDLKELITACKTFISTGTNIGAVVGNSSVYYKDIM